MRFATIVLVLIASSYVYADDPALITGRITVYGSRIEVSPTQLETPAGIPIFLNTTGKGLSGKLKGELRGPGISAALSFQTDPGSPFQLPALQTKGSYFFEDIRLENNGQILASATPERVEIKVIDILISQITSRPLSLEEIRSLGIVMNESDFTAVSFEIGLQFNSTSIPISFPLLIPKQSSIQPIIPVPPQGVRFAAPQLVGAPFNMPGAIPNFVPVTFTPARPEFEGILPDIPGVLVFPNDIAFLNQFVAVVLMVSNGASSGSNLAVDDLTAQMVFDPSDVKLVKTNPSVPLGTAVPVRLPGLDGAIGTADDLDLILATQTGKSEFFIEGLQEGTHTVRMNLNANVRGLVQGDVPITGTATGAILVRNPNFSVTFSHPSIVRVFEPYDLFVTVTNTSSVDANLVRLSIPSNELVNCVIVGDPFQDFETIRSGESATAKFRINPQITGQVTTAVITSNSSVKGQFQLRVSVGEKGIPLSPNTLLLPEFANQLGPELLQKGLSVLGLAFSAATAPPGGLPPGVPYVSKSIVTQRAIEFARAAQHFQLGESKSTVLSHLLLDWLGNTTQDAGFTDLLRTTDAGSAFLNELFGQLNVGATNALSYHDSFAENTFFHNRYLSAVLTSSNSAAGVSLTDASGNFTGDRFATTDGLAQWILASTVSDPPAHTLRISGTGGTSDLSIIVPIGSAFYQAEIQNLSTPIGKSYEIIFDAGLTPTELQLRDEQGIVIAIPMFQIQPVTPAVISAVQDAKADKTGHLVAVLFNQPVTRASAEKITSYSVAGNHLLQAQLQLDSRIVYLAFQNPISPLLENELFVSGVQTVHGNTLIQGTTRIQTTVTIEAGRITGRFVSSDGTPIPAAVVQLSEIDADDLFGEPTSHVTAATVTNAAGEFTFDYVRKLSQPFTISAQEPLTGDIGNSSSTVTYSNQLIRLDIVLLGRGTIKGKVIQKTGSSIIPMPNAVVTAIAANEQVPRQVLTDSSGQYLIDRVAVGPVNLSAQNRDPLSASKFFGATSTAVPLAGSVVNADIEVTTTQPGAVKGRVLQSNGADPIPGAYVLLSIGTTAAFVDITDAQGWFQFDQVPPGGITLKATDTATGRTIGSVNLSLAAGTTATVNIVSSGNGTIEAVVSLATGMVIGDVVVAVQGTQFSERLTTSSTAIFTDIPVGDWDVIANNTKTGDVVSVRARILYSGSTAIVSLRFSEKGTLSGEIKTVDQLPAANSTVLLFGGAFAEHLMAVATADANGRYLFKDLTFGKYVVHAISSNQTDGGSGNLTEVSSFHRNPVSNVTFVGKGTITVHVETSAGPVMTPVKLTTVTFDYDGTISRVITYTKTSDPITGNAVFTDVFRKPFTAEASTALTLPARVGGTLSGPAATVNILLTENPNISGIVHDADGQPIRAQVTYNGQSGTQTLTTAPDGTFTFNRIALGRAIFTASAGNTKGELERVIVAVNDPIDIHLIGFGSVHGMVKDADANPVGGANVKLIVPGLLARTLQSVSGPDGSYRFDSVPAVNVTVEAHDSARGGRAGVKIIHKADVPLDVILGATATVQGTAFQSDGVTRVVAAEVTLQNGAEIVGTATTDGNGNYLFQHVPVSRDSQDTYRLEAFSKNLGRRATSAAFLIASNNQILNQNLILEGLGSVEGFVFDYTGVQPIAGALLNLASHGISNTELNAGSGNDGDYLFNGVPQGSYTITARKDLLVGLASGLIARDGDAKTQNVLLQPGAEIRGVIQFFDGSQIPAGVNPVVHISSSVSGVLRVDAPDGNFHVTSLPYGVYTLSTNFTHANKPYRGIARITLDSPGETATILRLKGLNTLNVAVTGFIPGAANSIKLNYSNDLENRTESVAIPSDGLVQFLNVPESKYTLMAKSGDLLTASASGTLTGDGETATVTLPLTASGTVQGAVLRNGVAASGVSITLKGSSYTLFAYTDDAGQFSIVGVPLGAYTLSAEDLLQGDKAREFGSIDFENDLNSHSMDLDGLAPQVLSTTPAAGTAGVANGSTILVVFSEPMDAVSTRAAFSLTSGSGKVAGTANLSGAELTFVPSAALEPQKTYNIVVARSAQDLAGNGLSVDFVASFTSVDTVAPGINTTLPMNLAFNVPLNTTLQVYFKETIADRGIYTVTRSSGQPATVVNELWNPARTVLTLQFASPFVESERITFTISDYSDPVGNVQTTPTTIVFDTLDKQPPLAPSLTSTDADNRIREGTTVIILAAVAETLVNVDFFINGTLRFRDTTAPYQYAIPSSLTTIAANGGNQLMVKATATDRSGNTSPETNLAIELVPDLAPQITISTTPAPGNVVSGGTIRTNYNATDDGTITKVLIIVTGAINQTIDAGPAATGSKDVVLPGNLSAGSSIFIKARATDESGKSTTSASADFTVVADTQAPNVTLLLPDASAIYQTSQSILARASATDNARVNSVEFYGTYTDAQNQPVTLLLGTDTTPSGTNFDVNFEFPRTDTLVVFARAIDPSGNSKESASRTLQAALNEYPVVTFTEPSNGAQVIQKTTITLRATASDSDGSVASVKFYAIRNGVESLIAQDNSGPSFAVNYVVPQDSAPYALTLEAVASDNVGDTSTTNISVTAIIDPKATVTGRVIDINGSPVAGATSQLFLNSISVAMTSTDSSGVYNFTQASTIDGNYLVRITHALGIAETLQVKPVSPVTNMPDVVLRNGIDSKALPGLTSQTVTSVRWYDAAAERNDDAIGFDEAWRFGVLQIAGTNGNATHIHLSGYPVSPYNPVGWTLEIVDQSGPAAAIRHGSNTTTVSLSSQPIPITFGGSNTGLALRFDPNISWRIGDKYSFASWYLESPSSVRGGTQHFPAQAILLATNNEFHIYDASNDTLWMRFVIANETLFQLRVNAIDAMYGKIYAGGTATVGCLNTALNVVSFRTDSGHRYKANPACSPYTGGNFNGTLWSRNAGVNFTTSPNYPDVVTSIGDLDVTRIGDKIWIAAIGGSAATIKESPGTRWFVGPGGNTISWDEQGQLWYHTQTTLARATNTFSQITTIHTENAFSGTSGPRDIFVDPNFVYIGTHARGVDLYNRATGVYSPSVFQAPSKLAGNSNDIPELIAHGSRLWTVSQFNTGGLSVLDPFNGQFLASIPVPQIPSTHLSSIDRGSTTAVPLSLVVGSHAAGARHIKGDYQSIGVTTGLVVSAGKQNPPAQIVEVGEQGSVLQIDLNNGSGQSVLVNSITFQASGSGHDSSDVQISLYQDSDADGDLSDPDLSLGTGTYDADNGTANVITNLSLASNNRISLIAVYEWNNNAEPGRTYAARASSIDATYTGGSPVSILGLNQPITGSTFTVKAAVDVDVLNTQDPTFPNEEIISVHYYAVSKDPAGVASDPNWKNGVVKVIGNPAVNPASNIVVSGAQSNTQRLEIRINGDGTFSFRTIASDVAGLPSFTGGIPISASPQSVGSTGVSLSFIGTQFTPGDVFRIATWATEPVSGVARGAFPDEVFVIGTRRTIRIVDASTLKTWIDFHRPSPCAGSTLVYVCTGSNTNPQPLNDLTMLGGRLYFTMNQVSSVDRHHGLYVVDFIRDEAFRLSSIGNRYFGNTTAGTPRANLRERNFGYTYGNEAISAPAVLGSLQDVSLYFHQPTSTTFIGVRTAGGASVVHWGTTISTTGISGISNVVDLDFSPNGWLYIASSSGVISRSSNYTSVAQSRTISGIVPTRLKLNSAASSIHIGHTNGVRVIDRISLADILSYSLQGSQQVTALDSKSDHVFVGTSTESSGALNVFNTYVDRSVMVYTRDQGLPSNDITAVAVSEDPENFVAAVGTKNNGIAFLRGTLDQVTAFSGLIVERKELFATQVTPPKQNFPLLWFDLINSRPVAAELNSIRLTTQIVDDPAGVVGHLVVDVDRSGTVTEGDLPLGSQPLASSVSFVAPAGYQIPAHQRIALLFAVDLPASIGGGWVASLSDNQSIVASHAGVKTIVSGAPVTGNSVTSLPRLTISSPASNSTFTEGSTISVVATANHETEDVNSIEIQVTGVAPEQIARSYSPAGPASTRTVTATLALPTIASNGGSNQITITATSTDGTSVNSVSIPITMVPQQ